MEFPLKEDDILYLSNVHRGTRDKKVADRLKCIKLLNLGHDQSFIAELLEVDEKTVYNWKTKFLTSKSIEQYITDQPTPYSGKLDELKKTSL